VQRGSSVKWPLVLLHRISLIREDSPNQLYWTTSHCTPIKLTLTLIRPPVLLFSSQLLVQSIFHNTKQYLSPKPSGKCSSVQLSKKIKSSITAFLPGAVTPPHRILFMLSTPTKKFYNLHSETSFDGSKPFSQTTTDTIAPTSLLDAFNSTLPAATSRANPSSAHSTTRTSSRQLKITEFSSKASPQSR